MKQLFAEPVLNIADIFYCKYFARLGRDEATFWAWPMAPKTLQYTSQLILYKDRDHRT